MSKQKEKLSAPPSKLTFKIGPNSYSIDFPKNGDLIDIERRKSTLSGGQGQGMINGGSPGMQALILSESIATFSVLLPQLEKDLNVGSLLDLNPSQSKPIVKAYEKYYEWMDKWRTFLNQDDEKEESKDE